MPAANPPGDAASSSGESKPAVPPPGTGPLPAGHPPITPAPKDTPRRSRPGATEADGKLIVAGVSLELPKGWTPEKPRSSIRLAQYSLPGPGGPAELAVFGGIGGSAEANIERWIAQFADPNTPDDKPASDVQRFEQGGLKVSIVRASGVYSTTLTTPTAPAGLPKTGQALFGIIVEGGPRGMLFVKATGPEATIESHDQALGAFARSAALAE